MQAPDKTVAKSLGTSDRAAAIVLALPMIAKHKAKLLAARPRLETLQGHLREPGRAYPGPDGGQIIATDTQLIHMSATGTVLKTESNITVLQRPVGEIRTSSNPLRDYANFYAAMLR